MLQNSIATDTVTILQWIEENTDTVTSIDIVTRHPWAETFRVRTPKDTYYAKSLPSSQRAALKAMPEIARQFSGLVPGVLAVSPENGFLLLSDHQGHSLHSLEGHDRTSDLLTTYARMQATAYKQENLIALMPSLNLHELTDRLIRYFQGGESVESGTGIVGAAHFIGEQKAAYYAHQLMIRAHVLESVIERSSVLPPTINHCDLRQQNVAVREDGSLVLFDWDDSIVGPAGLSLHNFFSGCSLPLSILIDGPIAHECDAAMRSRLDAYIETLQSSGYSDREQLVYGLPGAFVAGVIRYLISYQHFPTNDEHDRKTIESILRRRTDDLLRALDEFSISDIETMLHHIKEFEVHNDHHAAINLMKRVATRHSDAGEIRCQLISHLCERGELTDAEEHCRNFLRTNPTHPDLRLLLGRLDLERLDLDAAIDHWTLAQQFGSVEKDLPLWISELSSLRNAVIQASSHGVVPTLKLSKIDDEHRTLSRLRTRIAAGLFREYGTLLLENVFAPELLSTLYDSFADRYSSQLEQAEPRNTLQVGDKRFMVTVDMSDPFDNPALYAPDIFMSLFARLLGEDFVLGSFTSVTALPGAADMRMHKDHPALFSPAELETAIPTFAVTVLVPLRGFDAEMGTTRVVKRSHHRSSSEAKTMEYQDPLGPIGSCLLMDYRLTHQGLANRSQRVRPVLSMVYNRSWFRDSANYAKQHPLKMDRQSFDRLPAEYRRLFQWLYPLE